MTTKIALEGAAPVRARLLPYGKQNVDEADVAAVVAALGSDWLTTGPRVGELEAAFAAATNAREAVAVCNGTAALHCAYHAAGVVDGDEVVVPAMTFAATANAVVYCGGKPVFADVDARTLLVDVDDVARKITKRTRAIVGVDYAGQPAHSAALRALAEQHGIAYVSDACHALGGADEGKAVGSLATLSTFSLHPVKPITSGEGGVITTNDPELARKMRVFRNHGITTDHRQRDKAGSFFYEMVDLGFNYRLTDIQCALATTQLRRLADMTARRQHLAARYDSAFSSQHLLQPLAKRPEASHAYHLYVVELNLEGISVDRAMIFRALRAENIGVNVHYIPVHLHPYYRERHGTAAGLCPRAERAWERILSLPIFPAMADADVDDVVTACARVLERYRR